MRIPEIYEAAKRCQVSKVYAYHICEKIERDKIDWTNLKPFDMADHGFGPVDCYIIREAQKIFWINEGYWSDYYGKHYPIT